MTTEATDEDTILQVTERLVDKNPDLARGDVESVVREEYNALAGRPVRDYLSVLTERAARKRLKKSAKKA